MTHAMKISGLLVIAAILAGCSTEPKTSDERAELRDDAATTVRKVEREDPDFTAFLNAAYGYAVFPSVGKGGLIAGGAYGHGVVYQQGQIVGYCDLRQATIGAQIGGQSYSEIIAFETPQALDNFKDNKFEVAAQASAVAIKSGAAATAKYNGGVAIFTHADAGLMAEAAVGGQQFTYRAR
jgi:lipid-binding SYLF domain-containing protein